MTLEQLRIFVAVADRRHMTRAALELGITQSAASAAIAALETRYDAKLFDRVGRGIRGRRRESCFCRRHMRCSMAWRRRARSSPVPARPSSPSTSSPLQWRPASCAPSRSTCRRAISPWCATATGI
jgi:Bacterial regulatory helix-turn-helix protein, lysR family